MSLPIVLQFLVAASSIWAEPSHVEPGAGYVSGRSAGTARVYGARGETVSFWAGIQAGRKPVEGLEPVPAPPGRGFNAPAVWQVLPVTVQGDAGAARPVWDRLAPPTPLNLDRDAVAWYWVSYTIPVDAPPGVEHGELRFETASRQRFDLPVRIEVFDFQLPAVTAYPLVAPINRAALTNLFGWDTDLADWQGLYALLGRCRLAPMPWGGGEVFQSAAAPEVIAHAGALLQSPGVPLVDLGGTGLTENLLRPSRAMLNRADPARLRTVRDGLLESGLATRAVVSYELPASRAEWDRFATLLDDHAARAPEIRRVVTGPPAFPLLPHADVWAIPFPSLTPALSRVVHTPGLDTAARLPVHLVQATASGRWRGYDTLPSDAFDGNVFTGWVPPAGGEAVPLEAQLAGPADVNRITLVWLEGHAARDIEVSTSRDGFRYTNATVDWEIQPARPDLGQPAVHRGTFKYAQTLLGLRVAVSRPVEDDGTIGVAEVMLPELADLAPRIPDETAARGPEIWTTITPGEFPAPMPGFSPAATLLLPWWCAARGASAAMLPGFNPPGDRSEGEKTPVVDAADAAKILVWPVSGGLVPSVRLERIRAGQQAYAYAAMARAAGITGDWVTDMPAAFDAIALGQVPGTGELDALLAQYYEWRIAAGRVLEKFRKVAGEETGE